METLKVKWTGIRPLIMENCQTIDPLNPIVKRLRKLNSDYKGQKKQIDNDSQSEETLMEIERLKWAAAAYWDQTLGFFVPGDNIAKCIRDGASSNKKGKQADAGLVVDDAKVQIQGVQRHKQLEDYYGPQSEFVLRTPIRIPPKTGVRIVVNRCIIPTGWKLLFSVSYDKKTISKQSVIDAMNEAGSSKGIGGWRPKFGRFSVTLE